MTPKEPGPHVRSPTPFGSNVERNHIAGTIPASYFEDFSASTVGTGSAVNIDLSDNRLTRVRAEAFRNVRASTRRSNAPVLIDLSNNLLATLDDDAFNNVYILTTGTNSSVTM